MKTFAIGDIHGNYKALKEVLDLSGLDYSQDILIVLGDVADGLIEVRLCFDELLKIKNLKFVLGNHDAWFLNWCINGQQPEIWTSQGGMATISSYNYSYRSVPKSHTELLKNALVAYIDEENRIFVHGGFDPNKTIGEQDQDAIMWDRSLFGDSLRRKYEKINKFTKFKEVYLGHTDVSQFGEDPINIKEIWNLDTGAGWSGRLTIMDIDTKEYFQSKKVQELYPYYKPWKRSSSIYY